MSAAGLVASISGTRMRKKANRALDKELANAPKYKITDEAFENQAIGRSQAYGRDRGIQMGQENIAQSAAEASASARNVTNSTSSLLSTISAINANKNQQLRGLAQDDSVLRNQKLQQLQGVNSQMIDERDKAWNYNENMPFQMRVAKYRDQAKVGSEMEMAGVAAQAQTESALISSAGSIIGAASDERIKKNIAPSDYGLSEVMRLEPVTYQYKRSDINHVGLIANHVENVIPEAVNKMEVITNEGPLEILGINYNEIVPVLVKAIQEQQKQIEELKQKLIPEGHFIAGSKLVEQY